MLLRVPHFFSQFKCLAGQCSDTCCVGWEIDIDDATLAKYRDMATLCECAGSARSNKKEFIRKLLKSIEGTHFKLEAGDRCPFLNQKGLCDVICNLGCNGTPQDENGESILCDICREHPRFVEVYGDIMEKGLGLCCEEAARLLLTSEPPPGARESCLTLMESRVDDPPDELPDGVEEARDAIFQEREAIFGILADKSLPLNERLVEVLDFAQALSDSEDTSAPDKTFPDANSHYEGVPTHQAVLQTWIEILGEGESFGPAWDEAYRKMHQKGWGQSQALFTEEDGARIVSYLIFRYYAKSLFDGDCLTKVQFSIFFWIILRQFGHELAGFEPSITAPLTAKVNAIKLLSKQTEYSEEIMDILANNFFENPAFSLEQFRRILE